MTSVVAPFCVTIDGKIIFNHLLLVKEKLLILSSVKCNLSYQTLTMI